MADVGVREDYTLVLSKREFVMVTKALCGKLDPGRKVEHPAGELEEAKLLGLRLLEYAADKHGERVDAFVHARELAEVASAGNGEPAPKTAGGKVRET